MAGALTLLIARERRSIFLSSVSNSKAPLIVPFVVHFTHVLVGKQLKRVHFSAIESLILKSNASHRNFKRAYSSKDNISGAKRKISLKPGQDYFEAAFWNS